MLNSTQTIALARADQLVVTVAGGTAREQVRIDIRLGHGQRFRLGRTVNTPQADLSADLVSDTTVCGITWFDIHDLAYDGDQIVRLDLSFVGQCAGLVVGDFQLGARATGAASSVRSLVWPDTPIGTHHPLTLPVWIRNYSSSPVVLGKLQRSGAQVAEFPLTSDGCSNRTLRSGDGCLVEVRFGPVSPGAKKAVLSVSAGAETIRIDLSGSAPSGRTAFALRTRPGNYLGNGYDRLLTDVFSTATATGSASSVEVDFEAAGYPNWHLWLRTPDRQPLKLGSQRFGYAPVDPGLPELSLTGEGRACGAPKGTFDLRQFSFRTDGTVDRFSIIIRQDCTDDPVPLIADISYRATDAPPVPGGAFVLRTGQQITSGATLRNTNGYAYDQLLTLRSDGKAVITDRSGGTIWTSPNQGWGRSYRLGVLRDGSVAITDAVGRASWRQAPVGIRPGDFLLLQSDGNLVLYSPDYHPLWSALPI